MVAQRLPLTEMQMRGHMPKRGGAIPAFAPPRLESFAVIVSANALEPIHRTNGSPRPLENTIRTDTLRSGRPA